jgi:tetratricopeptide (TPR) repeat protein
MNIINKTLILALAATTLLGTTACENKLTEVNPNAQTTASFWKTASDAEQGVNAIYLSLCIDGSYMRSTPLLLDNRGDDVLSNSPWDQMYNSGKFAMNAGNSAIYGWAFGAYYEGIFKANQVLDNVPTITMDAALKKRLLGEAYFLRGLYFYHLVNMFGNVMLPTHAVQTTSDFFVKQSTEAEGWAQVMADFQKAIDMLPASYTGTNLGRATKGAAMAYLGKTYLMNHKYSEAATQFKGVIDSGIYGLVPNYRDNFTEANENNKESIFEVQFDVTAGGSDLNWGGDPISSWGRVSARAITYGASGLGWTDVQPTRSVFNEFLQEKTTTGTDDPRLEATMFYNKPGLMVYGIEFAKRYAGNAGALNSLYCRKYENDGTKADEFNWRSGINERLMRYADVLMMYAECLNETGQTAAAYPYIQQVRSRVGLPNLATTKPNLTQAQMREQIGHERLLEFCLEGHRFDDIRRWGWLTDATKLAWLKSRDPEFETYKAGREFYPIPQNEIDNNPGVKQNPTY